MKAGVKMRAENLRVVDVVGGSSSSSMACHGCGSETMVVDSRPTQTTIRRRRKCLSCDERFTTFERREDDMLEVDLKELNRIKILIENMKMLLTL